MIGTISEIDAESMEPFKLYMEFESPRMGLPIFKAMITDVEYDAVMVSFLGFEDEDEITLNTAKLSYVMLDSQIMDALSGLSMEAQDAHTIWEKSEAGKLYDKYRFDEEIDEKVNFDKLSDKYDRAMAKILKRMPPLLPKKDRPLTLKDQFMAGI